MAAIIGKLNSPVEDNGSRTVIYLQTSYDAVFDPNTGETLREALEDRSYPNADSVHTGLMTSESYQQLQALYKQLVIMDENNPGTACVWLELLSTTDTTPDSDGEGSSLDEGEEGTDVSGG